MPRDRRTDRLNAAPRWQRAKIDRAKPKLSRRSATVSFAGRSSPETNAARRSFPEAGSAAKFRMKSVFMALTTRAPGARAATSSLELPP